MPSHCDCARDCREVVTKKVLETLEERKARLLKEKAAIERAMEQDAEELQREVDQLEQKLAKMKKKLKEKRD